MREMAVAGGWRGAGTGTIGRCRTFYGTVLTPFRAREHSPGQRRGRIAASIA